MKSLFGFQDTLDVDINGVSKLAENTTEAQRTIHKESKKKDYKTSFCIQSAVGGANVDMIAHAEFMKKA